MNNDCSLSAGRVQSVALLLCVQMMEKIKTHNIDHIYYVLIGRYLTGDTKLDFKLYDNQSNNVLEIVGTELLYDLLNKLDFKSTPNIQIKETKSSESPNPPYTTTSLQQDAYSRYKLSSKKTMHLAQELYENGYITYMRTDATNISNDFKNVLIAYIRDTYPDKDLAKFRNYKNKIANAQEAHEAIRITNVNKLKTNLSDDHNKLYDMIWKRTVASQMCNAEYLNIEVSLLYAHLPAYSFKHKKSFLTSKGYLTVYDAQEATSESICEFKDSMKFLKSKEYICEATIQQPPSLYNEVSLIKTLEKEGIGRPSTYASIIDKLLAKRYVEKGSNPSKEIIARDVIKSQKGTEEKEKKITIGGKSKDLLVPTELGLQIIEYLQNIVPFLLDVHFTANMENALDKICEQSISKNVVLADFYENHLLPVLQKYQQEDAKPVQTAKTSGIIKSKYGYCYYNAKKNKYTNIESYLKWRNISANQMTDKDIKFVKSLPKKLNDGNTLHLGPYGLYLKDANNKNLRLDKNKWTDHLL